MVSEDDTDVSQETHFHIPACNEWVSYQIRKIAGCACAANAGNVFPAIDFKGNR